MALAGLFSLLFFLFLILTVVTWGLSGANFVKKLKEQGFGPKRWLLLSVGCLVAFMVVIPAKPKPIFMGPAWPFAKSNDGAIWLSGTLEGFAVASSGGGAGGVPAAGPSSGALSERSHCTTAPWLRLAAKRKAV